MPNIATLTKKRIARQRASLTTDGPTERISAQAGPQAAFLACGADIVVYGGAAGGGKTWSLLMDAARWRGNPQFRGVIFRRTWPQIINPGGLLDEARNLYPRTGARWVASEKSWIWPSGARVQLSHMQRVEDREAWQGSQLALIAWDELTHFEEKQFWYLLSRARSMSGIRPYIRATCNPAPGWVREFLAPWVQSRYAGPGGPAASGEVRAFVRREGQVVWLVDGEETRPRESARTVTFIRSSVYDNQRLMDVNPDYLGNLMALPDVERRRLLEGDWDVFEGSFFSEWSEARHTCSPPYTPERPPPPWWNYRGGLDWGYRAPFAFCLRGTDHEGTTHVLETVSRAGLTNEAQADLILGVLSRWGVSPVTCLIGSDKSMWAQKTLNGVRGEADIEAFFRAGLRCYPSRSSRQHGWSVIRGLLHDQNQDDQGISRAVRLWRGYNSQLISQFPLSQYEKDGEDMDSEGDDHELDALRYSFDLPADASEEPPPAVIKESTYLPHALLTGDDR